MAREWSHSERALELPRVAETVASYCETGIGKAAFLELRPSFEKPVIENRLAETSEASSLLSIGDVPVYSNARDVRTHAESAAKGSLIPPEHLFRVAETLGAMARLRKFVNNYKDRAPLMWRHAEALPYLPELHKELESSVASDGEVLDTASAKLKSLRTQKNNQSKRIVERMQTLVSGLFKSYLQEPLYTQREGRYVVPVKAQFRGKVPGIVHDASGSGQTVFIEPEQIVGEMNKLREVEAAEEAEIERILYELSSKVGMHAAGIVEGTEAISSLDVVFARARHGFAVGGNAPEICNGNFIRIVEGHHPLLARDASVPLTVSAGAQYKSLLITGPNTGGKTVCLKTIGLYSLMFGMGLFAAARRVEYGPFAGIWADIGDEQSLQQSLSTFSGHLKNISRVFQNATAGSLALFDEIGAGTDPREGAALGKAIIATLLERGIVVVASTHYGELKEFALQSEQLASAAMEFDLKTLRPTYHLIPGASGASHAFEISRRHGVPANVVDKAEKMIGAEAKEEREKNAYLDELLSAAREEKAAIERLKSEAEELQSELQAQVEANKEKFARFRERAEEQLNAALRESRERYRELLEELNAKALSGAEKEDVLQKARQSEAALREASTIYTEPSSSATQELRTGMDVSVRGRPQTGKVLEVLKSGTVVVQINNVKLTVSNEDVLPAQTTPAKPEKKRSRTTISRIEGISQELHLRHMRVEEAKERLERFLDDAALAGLSRARIVHGKGEGVLRKIVKELLSAHKDVKSYAEASPDAGGSGVTLVEFVS